MKKIYYNKLIRDRIPEKIRKKGGTSKTRVLRRNEFERELLKKVEEEVRGLSNAKNRADFILELADVIDVLNEVKRFKKVKPSEIKKAQRENFKIKGGFKKRLYLLWSSDTGYRTNERKGRPPSSRQ